MIDLIAVNHTNRELELMLAGAKPLAVFSDVIDALPNEQIIPEAAFKSYVEQGAFIRQEKIFDLGFDERIGKDVQIMMVLFALPSEAWRIPAFILLKTVFFKTRRNPEELERIESHLLGYSEPEVDAWCARAYGGNAA
jgi:hypothetical protein